MNTRSNRYYLQYLLFSLGIVGLDQLTKYWILQNLELHRGIPVFPVFSIVHARNYGAAFGFMNVAGGWQTLIFAVIAVVTSVVILVWLKRIAETERQLSLALALVMGGAIGNLVDRVRLDYVVDFLSLHYNGWQFPAFNIADSAITLGAVLLLLDSLGCKILADRIGEAE